MLDESREEGREGERERERDRQRHVLDKSTGRHRARTPWFTKKGGNKPFRQHYAMRQTNGPTQFHQGRPCGHCFARMNMEVNKIYNHI